MESMRALETAVQQFKAAPSGANESLQLPDHAIDRLNKAANLLHGIIAKFKPDEPLPQLQSIKNLEDGITQIGGAIEELLNRAKPTEVREEGPLQAFGHALEKICKNVTPFLKVFLQVGVQGSAVRPPFPAS